MGAATTGGIGMASPSSACDLDVSGLALALEGYVRGWREDPIQR
jgi:hypothetical protein